jgi:hypothetical protein
LKLKIKKIKKKTMHFIILMGKSKVLIYIYPLNKDTRNTIDFELKTHFEKLLTALGLSSCALEHTRRRARVHLFSSAKDEGLDGTCAQVPQ